MEFKSFWNIGIWESKIEDLNTSYWIDLLKSLPSYKNSNGTHFTIDNIINISELKPLINNITKVSNFQNLELTDIWGNISPPLSQDYIHHHKTKNQTISGVLYLNTPLNSGDIVFTNPIDINQKYYYTPKEKSIIFFPSYLPHFIGINLSKENRISIAFDFSPK
jgi:hypothetical protein